MGFIRRVTLIQSSSVYPTRWTISLGVALQFYTSISLNEELSPGAVSIYNSSKLRYIFVTCEVER